jgi:periplasmic divalent cation tolerance protein
MNRRSAVISAFRTAGIVLASAIDCKSKPVVRSQSMQEFIVVYVTVSSAEEGARIARAVVEERLAACVNQLPGVRSTYRWQGKLEQSGEELLLIKTRKDLLAALQQRIGELHSYAVPEFIAVPIVAGSASYLQWLDDQVSPGVS